MNQNPPDNATAPRSVVQQQACSGLSEHSLAPWAVVKGFWPNRGDYFMVFHNEGQKFSSNANDHAVAWLHKGAKSKNDANLIAAAPELLEALKAIVTHGEPIYPADWVKMKAAGLAAIAKALGQNAAGLVEAKGKAQ